MSLEPIREDDRVVETAGTARQEVDGAGETAVSEPGIASPETGSAWWVELVFGSLCCLTAAAVALVHTSVGPLAGIRFVYGTAPTLLYLVVATILGVQFLRSGLR
jgi:hypothetical protein